MRSALFIAVLLAAACSSEDDPSTDCALGDWALTETATTGTCGIDPGVQFPLVFTIVDTGSELGVLCETCDAAQAFVEATAESCSLEGTFTFIDAAEGITEVHRIRASVDSRQVIGSGDATLTFSDGTPQCIQNFTLSGLLR